MFKFEGRKSLSQSSSGSREDSKLYDNFRITHFFSQRRRSNPSIAPSIPDNTAELDFEYSGDYLNVISGMEGNTPQLPQGMYTQGSMHIMETGIGGGGQLPDPIFSQRASPVILHPPPPYIGGDLLMEHSGGIKHPGGMVVGGIGGHMFMGVSAQYSYLENERRIETILHKLANRSAEEIYNEIVEQYVREQANTESYIMKDDPLGFSQSTTTKHEESTRPPSIIKRGPGRPRIHKIVGETRGGKRKKVKLEESDEWVLGSSDRVNDEEEEEDESYDQASSSKLGNSAWDSNTLPYSRHRSKPNESPSGRSKYRKYDIDEKLKYLEKAQEINSYRGACRALGLKWSTCRYWKKFEKEEEVQKERLHL